MTDPTPENREQQYSERFDRGVQSGNNEEENRILTDYRFLRQTARQYPVWRVDADALSQRMLDEYRKTKFSWLPLAACFVIALCSGVYIWMTLKTPNSSAIAKVAFTQTETGKAANISWLWAKRAARGRRVMIPDGVEAKFNLRDGSVIRAKAGAQISFDYTPQRDIHLQYGYIAVDAAHIEGSTMTVFTPHERVEVVGTKFWVNVK